MIVIRIPRKQWGKASRAMIEISPVRMIAKDPLVEVLPAHVRLLGEMGVPYTVVVRKRGRLS